MKITYNIPAWNKTKFEKYIKSIQRKGLNIKVEELGESVVNVDNIDYLCSQYSIESEVLYQEAGWQFIGTIEHKEAGNIIRKISDIAVPGYYRTAPNECEHCHTVRNRIDTYLVYNAELGEFKQVGKACLKAYTGLNPAICALAMDLDTELAKLEVNEEEVSLGGYNTYGAYRGYEADRIKKLAFYEIKKNGYKRNTIETLSGQLIHSTKDEIMEAYYDKKAITASDEDIQAVDAWVGTLDISHNDYYRNASIAYVSKYYEVRDLALVLSLISCFFKNQKILSEKAAREAARKLAADQSQEVGYLGNTGDKVEFAVAADSILFINEPYVYGGSYSYTHKIIDTKGHIILWTTGQGNPFEANTCIKATVKGQKEFRGELQTVITRGKLI